MKTCTSSLICDSKWSSCGTQNPIPVKMFMTFQETPSPFPPLQKKKEMLTGSWLILSANTTSPPPQKKKKKKKIHRCATMISLKESK